MFKQQRPSILGTSNKTLPADEGVLTQHELVREQLDRILASLEFEANERRRDILRYVVEETLSGRADRIKGFSIGVSVLGRSEDFDANADPLVRLEARRLRRELEHYYLTKGTQDPVKITIPKGSYVPAFEFREVANEEIPARVEASTVEPSLDWHERLTGKAGFLFAAAITMLLIAGASVLWYAQTETSGDSVGQTARARQNTPIIAVLPIETIGDTAFVKQIATGLAEDVITDLTRAQGLKVIAHSSSSRVDRRTKDLRQVASEIGATHVLRGSLQVVKGVYRLNVNLIEASSGHQQWAQRYDFASDDWLAIQAKIAQKIRSSLATNLQVSTPRDMLRTRSSRRDVQVLYRQALTILNPPSDRSRYVAGRAIIERVIELEPQNAFGYAGLAFLEAQRVWFGFAANTPEGRASVAKIASRALEIDPEAVRAHIANGVLQLIAGKPDQAQEHARRAIELRPSSSLAHAYQSVFLTFSGKPNAAVGPIKTAIDLDPINPRHPYRNMLAVAQFHAGNYEAALAAIRDSLKRQGPYGPNMMAYHAASLRALGREDELRRILMRLRAALARPDAFSVEGWLRRATTREAFIAPLLREIKKAKLLKR